MALFLVFRMVGGVKVDETGFLSYDSKEIKDKKIVVTVEENFKKNFKKN